MRHGQHVDPLASLPVLSPWDRFDYLVPEIDLLVPEARLEPGAHTIAVLRKLADSMPSMVGVQSTLPVPYTYFGQFIDHDITLTAALPPLNPDAQIEQTAFDPPSPRLVTQLLRNARTSAFDLDSVYGTQPGRGEEDLAVPYDGDKFRLGQVDPMGTQIEGKDEFNDVPRVAGGPLARRARIGDPRNDENLIVSQLHVAFLRFHNAVVDLVGDFDQARKLVTQHYQWAVVTDYLPRICGAEVVSTLLMKGHRLYRPRNGRRFMPLEFAAAAFRFGHSQVRPIYNYNKNFNRDTRFKATAQQLMKLTGLNGTLDGQPSLPKGWVADWKMLLADRAMAIDPTIAQFLGELPQQPGILAKLAARNLLKGLLFSLPTGQALAAALQPRAEWLSSGDILNVCSDIKVGNAPSQRELVAENQLHKRTPLWFYILAEARAKHGGEQLGPIGGLIVAETMLGLIRGSRTSILRESFVPSLGSDPGRFDLRDLLIAARVF